MTRTRRQEGAVTRPSVYSRFGYPSRGADVPWAGRWNAWSPTEEAAQSFVELASGAEFVPEEGGDAGDYAFKAALYFQFTYGNEAC